MLCLIFFILPRDDNSIVNLGTLYVKMAAGASCETEMRILCLAESSWGEALSCWQMRVTRSSEPMGFWVSTLEARVTTILTNCLRRFAHVDVM